MPSTVLSLAQTALSGSTWPSVAGQRQRDQSERCCALPLCNALFGKEQLAEGAMVPALQFTQAKADGQIRWAVLNITSILRRHKDVHAKLAAAMSASKPVSECIAVIESSLADNDDI